MNALGGANALCSWGGMNGDEVARIMRVLGNGSQWAEWRTPRPGSNWNWRPPCAGGISAVEPALVPPDANRDARFHVQFLQDVLHVFLHGARAALKNLPNLAVALAGRDPFHDFELALR